MAVPPRASNGPRDGREAAIAFAIPLEAIFEDCDLVGAALPLPNKPHPRLKSGRRSNAGNTTGGLQFCREALQALTHSGTRATERSFLYCVRQRPEEQLSTKALGWMVALKIAPVFLQGGMVKIGKRRNGLLDARLVRAKRSSRYGGGG